MKRELLKKVYREGEGNQKNCLVFEHDNKIWVMPKAAVGGAMEMYQPPGSKGKYIKNRIIKNNKLPFFVKGATLKEESLVLKPEIKEKIEHDLGIYDYYVAAYMGDDSIEQNHKVALQIYSKDEIYAFMKITEDEQVAKLFKNEIEGIEFLREKGIDNIPRILSSDFDSDLKSFIQLTSKPMYQDIRLDFSEQTVQTIEEIVSKTKKQIPYNQSDFSAYVDYLKEHMDVFDKEQTGLISQAINMVEEADINEFAFVHGDYTPWNVYYVKGEMQLFDLEYCSKSMPLYMDVFHFLSQSMLLGKRPTAQCVMREYERNLKMLGVYMEEPKLTFICYVLWFLSFYTKRFDESKNVKEVLAVWVEMLDYLINYL